MADGEKVHPTFGGKLKHWRQDRGLSLRDLEDLSGVSYGMIGQLERGVTNPSYETASRLAKALRIPVQYLWDLAPLSIPS